MNARIRTLAGLQRGEKARIKKLHAKGKLLHKFLDMGFVNNAEVEIIREAPLFDPIELKLLNYNLSVRKSEAQLIEVEEWQEKK